MNFQRDELWNNLTDKGWEIDVMDNYDFHRWSQETWRLRSAWSHTGTVAYVAFLLDPMEIRPEKEYVWAVAIYSEPPHYGVLDKYTMPLKQWTTSLPKFLQVLESMRSER